MARHSHVAPTCKRGGLEGNVLKWEETMFLAPEQLYDNAQVVGARKTRSPSSLHCHAHAKGAHFGVFGTSQRHMSEANKWKREQTFPEPPQHRQNVFCIKFEPHTTNAPILPTVN